MHRIPVDQKVENVKIFPEWIQEHYQALQKYCRSLTGSVWEGDDLVQEAWMKVWSYVQERPLAQIHISRAFLYRTARNAWIDQGRRRRLDTVSMPMESEQTEESLRSYQPYDRSTLHQVMELMIQKFSPEQRTVLLLIDGLMFTSREVSGMLNMTEGAVKALLHRVRAKLRVLTASMSQDDDSGKVKRQYGSYPASKVDESTVYAYIKAFHEQDAASLLLLMNEGSRDVLPAVHYVHKDRSRKKSHAEMKTNDLMSSYGPIRSMAA
ncbi:RNA polymerase sigma factor [Paenibacillus sp. D2_2]|uniref:RNA polymerase sigma factor n=1 Tax=Paenibacillus sp. D2_2 TaxID=3073092 RepID=UPI0028155246|nr:RNA polymerase sigma factor [Paenibacillus sp. D2_2]WMT41086.1 RNA polymerase sigma factor [Paenibacillus sp. D2_2]